jgi:hypothetical protein
MTPPTTHIQDEEELHTFIRWYFQNIQQLIKPAQITSYIHKHKIDTWKKITPQTIYFFLKGLDEIGVDNRFAHPRYYLKGEYGHESFANRCGQ